MANRISLDDSLIEAVVKMAEGNPGAAVACAELLKRAKDGFIDLCHLDDMGIYGPAIWVAYKDFAKQDIAALSKAIRSRDRKMFDILRGEGFAVEAP